MDEFATSPRVDQSYSHSATQLASTFAIAGKLKTFAAVDRFSRRGYASLFEIVCLLIRNTARFIIKIQEAKSEGILVLDRWSACILKSLRTSRRVQLLVFISAFALGFGAGWIGVFGSHRLLEGGQYEAKNELSMDAVVDRIIVVESNGDQNAKNKRSSATGLGQFLDQTWLELIRAHRSDLVKGRNQDAILELRRDGKIARELTIILTEQNAAWLKKRSLPVTPGTLYLAHFAGAAGAAAILSAVENADAASVMASADASGRTKREVIVKANPFLKNFTVADLRSWADRKMRIPGS
jgi:hypothetical protein